MARCVPPWSGIRHRRTSIRPQIAPCLHCHITAQGSEKARKRTTRQHEAISSRHNRRRTISHADPAPAIHYAQAENLEQVDVELIDSAKHEIDFVAYVVTDWPVMQALIRAADRGVNVRIYLDGTQPAEREPTNRAID